MNFYTTFAVGLKRHHFLGSYTSRKYLCNLAWEWSFGARLSYRDIKSRRKIVVRDARWKRRACYRQGSRQAVVRWRMLVIIETRWRNEVSRLALARSPAITILSFFRPCVWSSSGFRSPVRSAFLYLMSSFPAFFQPPADIVLYFLLDRRSTAFAFSRPSQKITCVNLRALTR